MVVKMNDFEAFVLKGPFNELSAANDTPANDAFVAISLLYGSRVTDHVSVCDGYFSVTLDNGKRTFPITGPEMLEVINACQNLLADESQARHQEMPQFLTREKVEHVANLMSAAHQKGQLGCRELNQPGPTQTAE